MLVAGVAVAQTSRPITIRWTAPAGCPAESDLYAEVDRLLGGPPDATSERHLIAEADVSHAGAW